MAEQARGIEIALPGDPEHRLRPFRKPAQQGRQKRRRDGPGLGLDSRTLQLMQGPQGKTATQGRIHLVPIERQHAVAHLRHQHSKPGAQLGNREDRGPRHR